jgi:hypothetical protein
VRSGAGPASLMPSPDFCSALIISRLRREHMSGITSGQDAWAWLPN